MRALLERQNEIKSDINVKTAGVEYGCQRYGIGRNSMRQLAQDADAVVKIGRRWLFNIQKVDRYLDSISE